MNATQMMERTFALADITDEYANKPKQLTKFLETNGRRTRANIFSYSSHIGGTGRAISTLQRMGFNLDLLPIMVEHNLDEPLVSMMSDAGMTAKEVTDYIKENGAVPDEDVVRMLAAFK